MTLRMPDFREKAGRRREQAGHGSGANWSLSRWGKSTGKWAEQDMDVALELAQMVDQLVNQERMKALMS